MGAATRRAPGAGAEGKKGDREANKKNAPLRSLWLSGLAVAPTRTADPLMGLYNNPCCLPSMGSSSRRDLASAPTADLHWQTAYDLSRSESEMGECKGGAGDCQIKLFGKTIPVPEAGDAKVSPLLFCLSHHFISPLLVGFMLRGWSVANEIDQRFTSGLVTCWALKKRWIGGINSIAQRWDF
jgi:hypothetical protein